MSEATKEIKVLIVRFSNNFQVKLPANRTVSDLAKKVAQEIGSYAVSSEFGFRLIYQGKNLTGFRDELLSNLNIVDGVTLLV